MEPGSDTNSVDVKPSGKATKPSDMADAIAAFRSQVQDDAGKWADRHEHWHDVVQPLSATHELSESTRRMLDEIKRSSALLTQTLEQRDWLADIKRDFGPSSDAIKKLTDSLNLDSKRLPTFELSDLHLNSAPKFDLPDMARYSAIDQLDLSQTPQARTADGVEQLQETTNSLLEVMRVALQIQSQTQNAMATITPELTAAVARTKADGQRNFRIAITALVVSVVVGCFQLWQSWYFHVDDNLHQAEMARLIQNQSELLKRLADRPSAIPAAATGQLPAAPEPTN